MFPELSNKKWSKLAIDIVKEKFSDRLTEQVNNILSTQQTREEDGRTPTTIYNNLLASLLCELSVAMWLKGEINKLEFNSRDPYSYAWDVFALGRRIEVKKIASKNFNIQSRRGGNCVDMTSFERYDIAELLFACKVQINSGIIIKPIFIMTRESYFNCKTKSIKNSGYYLQYGKEARDHETCKVYND